MDHLYFASQLQRNLDTFVSFFEALSPAEYTWKPSPEKWSLLEILCHLHDEEIEDFRARTRHILETPGEVMPSINPEAWVKERAYSTWDIDETLVKFKIERVQSVAWLAGLKKPQWDNFYNHPKVGPIKASLILTNWVAHDYLHIRQILRLKYEYLKANTTEPLDYAGNW